MAKSIRSKHKRKMRAVKRVRYGIKELERLKKTVANDPTTKIEIDEIMTDISEIATVSDAKTVKNSAKNNNNEDDKVENNMKNKSGSYPVWMHQRKIKKKVQARRRHIKDNKKKGKGKRKK